MINYDDVTKVNINKHNVNWPRIPDNPYRILIIGGSESGKINALINQIKQKGDDDYNVFDKIYLYVKNLYEAKYQYLVKKHEKMVLKI